MSLKIPRNFEDSWFVDTESDPIDIVLFGIIGGAVSLLVALLFAHQVKSFPLDTSKKETLRISNLIHTGAKAFLISEYQALMVFIVITAIVLAVLVTWQVMINFLVGAALSATSGYIGMSIATLANVRTTLACQGDNGLNNGLKVAFKSGAVMALMVVSTGLLGIAVMFLIFEGDDVWEYMSGFAFGGSSIALFARVGGGIYTKAADVGADLVGKVEEELDEDSPDNPATIADNVGDNVGDVAGMGADLFESFTGSIIAAATLANEEIEVWGPAGVALPFYISGLGAIVSIIGIFLIKVTPSKRSSEPANASREELHMWKAKQSEHVLEDLLHSIRLSIWGSSVAVIAICIVALGLTFGLKDDKAWNLLACIIIGLACGNLIGYFTEYATSYTYAPTQRIAEKSDTGAATVIIEGLGVGMLSTVPPVIFIVATILSTYYITDSVYGVSIAAVGMLSTLGITLATDAFGPVADNAGGIAEMAPDDEISDEVRETTDALDALGNTTAATGKGFAIGSAVLTAVALMRAFALSVEPTTSAPFPLSQGVNLLDPVVLPAVLIGALLPFLFAALTMLSVGTAAESIMWECRDQLNEKYLNQKELDPQKCVRISTISSLKEMVPPGVLAVFTPLIIGTLLGGIGVLGLLIGAISAGFLLAVMMANAGGAWDNAKKYVEKGNLGVGKGKKSDNHKATVVGDTVGDPFKDTSGPALNILIKLMSIVSLVMGPKIHPDAWQQWEASLVFTAVLFLILIAHYLYADKFVQLHDKEKIDRMSAERKGQESGKSSGKPAASPADEAKADDPVALMKNLRKGDASQA